MRLRTWLLLTALLTMVLSAHSQTCNNHTVTATITDATFQVWQNGSFTVSLYNPSGGQRPVCRNTGVAITTNYSGSMNASGVLSVSLPDTSAIDPAGTQWVFTISPNAGPQNPSLMNPVNVTANVDFSSSFSSQVLSISITKCDHTCYGYNTSEVLSPLPGSLFFNTSVGASPQCNLWSSFAWVGCGTSGGATTIQIGTGPPSGGCTGVGNVGSLYLDRESVLSFSIGPALYVCSAVSGPLFLWAPLNNWGGTGATNSPGSNSNWVCVSNTSPANTCTWQAIPIALPVLAGSGTPTPLCSTNVNGQLYNDYTNLISYICQGSTPTSGTWIQASWAGVRPTNTPGSTANEICVSNGAPNSCTWQTVSSGSSGAYQLLYTHTISNEALVTAATRNAPGTSGTVFQTDFIQYDVRLVNFLTATDGTSTNFRYYDGSTCRADATYNWGIQGTDDSHSGYTGANNAAQITINNQTSASIPQFGIIYLNDPTNTTFLNKPSRWYIYGPNTGTDLSRGVIGQGNRADGGPTGVDWSGICFFAGSGNLNVGTIEIYGIK